MAEKSKPRTKLWVLAGAVIVAFAVLQLALTVFLGSKGEELAELEVQAAELERQNELIKQELTEKSSLSIISTRSEELGLGQPENYVYLNLVEPVAALTLP